MLLKAAIRKMAGINESAAGGALGALAGAALGAGHAAYTSDGSHSDLNMDPERATKGAIIGAGVGAVTGAVAPELIALVALAKKKALKEDDLKKTAAGTGKMVGDALMGGVAGSIPFVGSPATLGGMLAGLLSDDAKKDIKERGHDAKSLIPGVASYRGGRVQRAVADESGDKGRKQLLHEQLGSVAGTYGGGVLGALAGGAAGAALGSDEMLVPGALIGGAAGMVAPNMAAALLALARKRRSISEQEESEDRNILSNYIPGVATYNLLKRTGHGYGRYFGN